MIQQTQLALACGLFLALGATSTASASAAGGTAGRQAAPADPRLSTPLAVRPALQPLSALLKTVEEASGVSLRKSDAVPDEPVFAAASRETGATLLRHLRLLLADEEWQYRWANRRVGKESYAYLLWRTPADPKERRAYEERRLRERLARLLGLLRGGPQEWERLAKEDPDLAGSLRDPMFRSRLTLVGQLSPAELKGVLSGQPLVLPVSGFSPQARDLIRQGTGEGRLTTLNEDGSVRVLFDSRNLDHGRVVISATRNHDYEPNSLSLQLQVFTEPAQAGQEQGASGGDVLYPGKYDEHAEQRKQIRRHQVAKAIQGTQAVTLRAGMQMNKDEPPLVAYLREFQRQTMLTVLAYWPEDATEPQKRLPRDIVSQPIADALDILSSTYHCAWTQDGSVIRFRHKKPGRKEDR